MPRRPFSAAPSRLLVRLIRRVFVRHPFILCSSLLLPAITSVSAHSSEVTIFWVALSVLLLLSSLLSPSSYPVLHVTLAASCLPSRLCSPSPLILSFGFYVWLYVVVLCFPIVCCGLTLLLFAVLFLAWLLFGLFYFLAPFLFLCFVLSFPFAFLVVSRGFCILLV